MRIISVLILSVSIFILVSCSTEKMSLSNTNTVELDKSSVKSTQDSDKNKDYEDNQVEGITSSEEVSGMFNSNQELLNFLYDNSFVYIEDNNWFIEFNIEKSIRGITDSGHWVEDKYVIKEINLSESYVIFNILESVINSEDETIIEEKNDLWKIVIEKDGFQSIAFTGTDEEVISYWILVDN